MRIFKRVVVGGKTVGWVVDCVAFHAGGGTSVVNSHRAACDLARSLHPGCELVPAAADDVWHQLLGRLDEDQYVCPGLEE